MDNQIILYTDGACTGNPGPGGRGVVIICKDNLSSRPHISEKPVILSGKSDHTTNNQMELTAVIKGLERLCQKNNVALPQISTGFTGFDFGGDQGKDSSTLFQQVETSLGMTKPIVGIYTDSQYVKQGIEERIVTRKRNGRRTSNRKPVANRELWQELDALVSLFDIQWHRVKGHKGNKYNEIADKLATGTLKPSV